MGSALLPQSRKKARDAQNAAAVLAFPTTPPPAAGDATCAPVAGFLSGAYGPRVIKASFRSAASAVLSDAVYVGYNAADGIWEVFGLVNEGEDVTLSDTRGFGQLLHDVPGVYSHVSVVGTLSASTLTVTIDPIEAR